MNTGTNTETPSWEHGREFSALDDDQRESVRLAYSELGWLEWEQHAVYFPTRSGDLVTLAAGGEA